MANHFARRITAFVLAAVMALSLAGCGSSPASESVSSAASSSVASSAASETESGAILLTDQAGREVKLEKPAETIVSCYYVTTYATMALGISDRVVGLEKKADSRPIYQMAAPELLEKTAVGTLKEFNVEGTAALNPDLVLMPKKLMDHADTLTDLGIAVLVVDPENQEKLNEMLLLIGKAAGVEDKAEALVKYNQDELQNLAGLVGDLEKPTVYMAGNSDYLTTAPAAMYQNSLIEQAGGVNAAKDVEGDYWTQVSYESLLAMAPEVIVVPGKASYSVQDILNDAQLKDLPAVKNGAVYQMPTGIEEWDSPIPSGVLGSLWLASLLHSDVYSFEQFTKDAQEFYKTFYGFDLDSALVTH